MFEYTKENYLQFGYDDKLYVARPGKNSALWCRFNPITHEHSNFKEECLKTAELIRTKTSEDLYVLFSGGMDSEVVLKSFIEAGINVNAITVEFKNGWNEHDISWSRKFCKKFSINQVIVGLDLEEFWKTQLNNYALPTQCNSPQFPVVMWLADQTPGFPIIGSGDSAIKRLEGTNDFVFDEQENYLTLYLHFMQNEIKGVPAFFQYTPELLLSFFEHPVLQEYTDYRARQDRLISISRYKYPIYNHSFPDLENREVYNGYEKVESLDQRHRQALHELCPGAGQKLRFQYKEFIHGLRSKGCETSQDSH